MDLRALVQKQVNDTNWGNYAQKYRSPLRVAYAHKVSSTARTTTRETAATTTKPILLFTPSPTSQRHISPISMNAKSTNSSPVVSSPAVPTTPKAPQQPSTSISRANVSLLRVLWSWNGIISTYTPTINGLRHSHCRILCRVRWLCRRVWRWWMARRVVQSI